MALAMVPPTVSASSPELTSPTGAKAPVGTFLRGTNVEHGTTTKVVRLTTSLGNVECAEATLTGELTENTGSHIAGNITTTEFRGKPAEPSSQHCFSGFGGDTTVTPAHITNPTHNGVSSLPWCITANDLEDQFDVRGGKCSEEARALTFTLHTKTLGSCTYQKTSLSGTYTTHPAAAVLTLQSQEFIKITGSPFCPGKGTLDMAVALETDPEAKVGEPVYVTQSPPTPPELTAPTGTRTAVGTLIQGTNVEHGGTSKVLKMTTSLGNVECAEAILTGELTANAGSHIAGNITTVEFRGKPAEPASQHCTSGFGSDTTVTPNHITNPTHNGVSSLPWCITASDLEDQFTVRGAKCSEAARALTFTLHTKTLGSCTYQKASITGTYTTHPAAAVLTIQSQELIKITGSAFCPGKGTLDMAVKLETDGESPQDIYVAQPSLASPELRSPTGSRAHIGTFFQGTNVEHAGTSGLIRIQIPGLGNIECAEATLTGELTANSNSHIAGNITTAEFRGKPSEPSSQHCPGGFFGNFTVTPSHTTNPSHNGVSSLPWCITASGLEDQFTVRGGKCSEASRSLLIALHFAAVGTCSYQKSLITGTYTTHPAVAVLTIQSQTFTKVTGGGSCPSEISLSMAFTLETDEANPQDAYIK